MIKFKEKQIRLLLIFSIVINVLFLGYGVKKILWKYSQYKSKQVIELNNTQPDSVTYFIGRNEVFTKLPNDSDEVIMLGNSLTHNFEWHEVFKNVNIKNRGINSDITRGILQRLNEIVESKPKKLFIEIGINDLLHGFPIDSVFLNYTKIIKAINLKSPKTQIYIQNVLPTKRLIYNTNKPVIDSVNVLNKKLKNYSEINNLKYIDLFSKFVKDEKLNPIYDCGDNLHLSGAGYLEWCKLIKEYVNE
ncbi:GDSL-type esterase/lipase family protein [Winogradskyella undariae]|uniref:GDSL-type esterase/lipase family protein n=1 Tax=Winogradskyella undariae TaxID=1285465 RepID=UPI0015C8BF95|nr:GDSL-type esterase/lipase family protein [Winogradskyella undariae]